MTKDNFCFKTNESKKKEHIKSTSKSFREFPGGPVAKTPHSYCRRPGFDPWLGN